MSNIAHKDTGTVQCWGGELALSQGSAFCSPHPPALRCPSAPAVHTDVGGKDQPLFVVVFTSKRTGKNSCGHHIELVSIYHDFCRCSTLAKMWTGYFFLRSKNWFRNTFILALKCAGRSGCAEGTTQHFAGVVHAVHRHWAKRID